MNHLINLHKQLYKNTIKKKVITDIVHGYIEINEIDQKIIDLPIFQRLTRIRQGLNRSTFPNCNHTRFEHSLGVAYIGSRIFEAIYKKASESEKKKLKELKTAIRLACLLHDIGHAPLSHIGELFYNKRALIDSLCNARGHQFRDQFENAAPHELMSALIVLKNPQVSEALKNQPKEFIADMICGNTKPYKDSIEFALIQLLYSPVDADRLDYVLRDNVMAGGTFFSIDKTRMIESYCIDDNKLRLDYRSFSTIGSFMGGRSNIYMFMINHHRNVLSSGLHYEFINQLIKEKKIQASKYFSYKALAVNLIDDYDLLSKLKKFSTVNNTTKVCSEHIFNRGYLSPLWKSGIECDHVLANLDKSQRAIIYSLCKKETPRLTEIENYIEKEIGSIKDPFFVFQCRDKHYEISELDPERDSINILLRTGAKKKYQEIFHSNPVQTNPNYFYVYLPKKSTYIDDVNSLFKPTTAN